MRTALLVLALLAAPAIAGQTVWKWVDDKGVTHYSDQPVPGAERIDIATGNRAEPRATPSYSSSSPSTPATQVNYVSLEILKPSDQETFVNTAGVIDVRVRSEPELQSGHSLVVLMDGRKLDGSGTDFTIQEVPRGQHTLIATIQDGRGRRIKESAPVQFHVRQESVAQPPVGPTLRPRPKPRPQAGNKPVTSQPSYANLNDAPVRIDPRTNKPVRP